VIATKFVCHQPQDCEALGFNAPATQLAFADKVID
jgi:hypothetical protein